MVTYLLFFNVFQNANAQNCFCQKDSFLNNLISCDTIKLKGNSSVYYQFNCDASWLTYENSKGRKTVLYFLDSELIDLTYKLGWQVWKDFDESVLFVARETSGLPTTLYYTLFNKTTEELISFRNVVYACPDSLCEFILYFPDSTYNFLSLFMINNSKEYKIELPKNLIEESFQQYFGLFMFVENLFEPPSIKDNVYIFKYTFFDNQSKTEKKGELSIDLKEFLH
jgi:hypothetical protein